MNREENRTPGPWADYPTPTLNAVYIRGRNGERVAEAGCRFDDSLAREECLANARLIAAAPELLRVAQLLASLCPDSEGMGGHAPIGAFLEAGRQARAAIAKANGEVR